MTIQFHTHPQYDEIKPDWEIYTDLFKGHHEIMTSPKYLWLHEFEQDTVSGGQLLRKQREERTRYVNFFRPFVERFVSIIFHKDPDVSEVQDMFGDFFNDVDGLGTDFINFVKTRIAAPYFLYGKPMILTDSHGILAANRLEEQQSGLRPYWEWINPLEAKDWQREQGAGERKGRLNDLRCEYNLLEPRASLAEEPKHNTYSKLLMMQGDTYTAQIYKLITSDAEATNLMGTGVSQWELVSESAIGNARGETLSEIPIAMVERDPWVRRIAPLAMLRHNIQSSLDNVLAFQAWQRVFASGLQDTQDALVLNVGTVTLVPEGASIEVVNPADTSHLEERLSTVTQNMFRIAFNQTRSIADDSAQVASFQTIRELKEEFIKEALVAMNDIQEVTNKAIRDFATFSGITDFEGEVKFNRDLTVEDIDEQLKLMQLSGDRIKMFPTWNKAVTKKLARQMQLQETEEILEEIDAKEFETESAENPAQERGRQVRNILLNGNREEQTAEEDPTRE